MGMIDLLPLAYVEQRLQQPSTNSNCSVPRAGCKAYVPAVPRTLFFMPLTFNDSEGIESGQAVFTHWRLWPLFQWGLWFRA